METNTAPDLEEGYPSKGKRLGPAWTDIWAELSRYPQDWREGQEVWTTAAEVHSLHPATLRALMFRMVAGGILEREARQVITGKGKRTRTYFRIKAKP